MAKRCKAGLTAPGLSFDFAQDEPAEMSREGAVSFVALYPPYESRNASACADSSN